MVRRGRGDQSLFSGLGAEEKMRERAKWAREAIAISRRREWGR